jgi:PPP family 3-phenylpropionic acid transporter
VPRTIGYAKSKFAGVPKAFWTLSSIEFLFWFAAATGTYLTVFLQSKGFQPADVGIINAVNSAVSICATPFWGMMADKFRSIRKIFIGCIAIAAVLWAAVPMTADIRLGATPIFVMHLLIPFSAFFRMPANSLIDAFVVQTSARENVAYGNVRLWGSISFAIMGLCLSAILPITGVQISFYMYGFAFIPLMIIMARMKEPADKSGTSLRKSVPFREMQFGRLFKNYYFLTYMVFAVFMHMPMNTSMAFLPYLVEAVGGNPAQLGLVTGYRALLEIPMLLLMKPLRRRFPLPLAITLSCILYTAEFYLYSYADSLLEIMFIQTLHGLATGLMIGSATNYVFTMAPEGLNSTAHTVNGAMNSSAAIIGNLLGSVLITYFTVQFGDRAPAVRQFYMVAGTLIFASSVYFVITLLIGSKILKKPIPRST